MPGSLLLRCLFLVLVTLAAWAQPPRTRLLVGINRDFPPFEYLDAKGQPAGYDVDLLKAVAELEGLDLEFRAEAWDVTLEAFKQGRVDLLPGLLHSTTRESFAAFSMPHLVVHYAIFVRRGDTRIKGVEDLPGHRILVERQSQMHDHLRDLGLGAGLILADSEPDALRRLARGEGDAAAAPQLQGLVLSKTNHLPLATVGGPLLSRQLCFATQKHETELVSRLNTGLAILNQTGRYAEIYRTWLGGLETGSRGGMELARRAFLVLAITLGALLLAMTWNWVLRRRVLRATQQLLQANREIRRRESYLHSVIENLPVAIFGKDPRDGYVFTLWNARSEEIFGLKASEVLGRSDFEFFPKDQAEAFRARDREVVEGLKPVEIPQEQVLSKALGTITLHTRKVPVLDEAGQPFLLLGIAENITEQRALEEALRQAQKLESLGILAGGIAHDFNNLLTAILGNVGLAQARASAGLPPDPYLDRIEQTTRRAAELTRQMLAYSGRGVFVKVPLALDQAVRQMVDLLQVSISKKVRLRFDFAEGLSAVEGDPAQIQQVIMNLVTNAAEAIGEAEGEILLSLGMVDLDPAQVQGIHPATPLQPGRYVSLSVRDTGIGMSAQTMARMFDPFFTTKFSGRGLGMSAMLGILRAHQAGIGITSELGLGTEFRVFLPETTKAVLNETRPSPAPWPKGSVRLLVVDDEPDLLAAISSVLELLDCQVIQARDGQEAVDAYFSQDAPIQAVLMDLTMPRMDGLEAAAEILRRDPKARLILTSGFSQTAKLDLRSLGLAGFLQKPFDQTQLLEALRPVLGEGF